MPQFPDPSMPATSTSASSTFASGPKAAREFQFDIVARDGLARAGTITTPHGTINTPTFTVVGTYGRVRFIPPARLRDIGAQAMLSNGYHLFRDADAIFADGGLAQVSGWGGPTITDSGGFQAMSLGSGLGKVVSMDSRDIGQDKTAPAIENRLAKVTDEGVSFTNPVDGRLDLFTPEVSIETQFKIGADITMAFDELTSIGDTYEYNVQALERTERWAVRSLDHMRALHRAHPNRPYQALYGVLQGAHYQDLREHTAHVLGEMEFDGYGLGGAFEKEQLGDILFWTNTILPKQKPRHLLGLARPDDIFVGVSMGIDTFDCVSPTREARHGRLYTADGYKNIMRSRFINDPNPIEPGCDCPTCNLHAYPGLQWTSEPGCRCDRWLSVPPGLSSGLSKPPIIGQVTESHSHTSPTHVPIGVLRSLLKSQNQAERQLGYQFTSAHNVRFILRLMEQIRANIIAGTFTEFRAAWLRRYNTLELP